MKPEAAGQFSDAGQAFTWSQAAAENAEKQLRAELLPYWDRGFAGYPKSQQSVLYRRHSDGDAAGCSPMFIDPVYWLVNG